jgi:hypothetical protein
VLQSLAVTLKQHIHQLVDELPDDSPVLAEVNETLRLNRAIGEALEDSRAGRVIDSDEFMKRVEERWPTSSST